MNIKDGMKINIWKKEINHNKWLEPQRSTSFSSEIKYFTRNAYRETLPDCNLLSLPTSNESPALAGGGGGFASEAPPAKLKFH